jgi:hypothetical protein
MNIHETLVYLYPTLEDGDVSLRQVGISIVIAKWNTAKLGTQPTQTQLEAAWPAAQLAAAKTQQEAILYDACGAAITGGFISSALGSPHTYPSTLTDQHNLDGSVVSSLLPNLPSTWTTEFWVMDSSGVWTFANHTVSQIQQAGLDGKAWVTTNQNKLRTLMAQLKSTSTSTPAEVQAIVW